MDPQESTSHRDVTVLDAPVLFRFSSQKDEADSDAIQE